VPWDLRRYARARCLDELARGSSFDGEMDAEPDEQAPGGGVDAATGRVPTLQPSS
jgi:hypothetical protein